jgi:hypothetical protein
LKLSLPISEQTQITNGEHDTLNGQYTYLSLFFFRQVCVNEFEIPRMIGKNQGRSQITFEWVKTEQKEWQAFHIAQ